MSVTSNVQNVDAELYFDGLDDEVMKSWIDLSSERLQAPFEGAKINEVKPPNGFSQKLCNPGDVQ